MPVNMRLLLLLSSILAINATPKPCSELSNELRQFSCNCDLHTTAPYGDEFPVETEDNEPPTVVTMECDRASFSADMSPLPRGAPIFSYKHTKAGLRSLPPQIFTSGTPLAPLRIIDLSQNSLRRLSGGQLYALRDTLLEVKLSDNLLGDTLNPILSTGEFRGLGLLRHLDISRNGIRAVEAGIFRGCEQLRELILDGNRLINVPANELGGPLSLRILRLKDNQINELPSKMFANGQLSQLELLDLSGNGLTTVGSTVFFGTPKLSNLYLSHNRISRLDSDAFDGTENLRVLDLSDNYLNEVPGVVLSRHASTLTHLNLSANRIKILDNSELGKLTSLQSLNLSRNEINNLAPGTFLGLRRLKILDLGVNSLRAIEDDAFEGLHSLEKLNLIDNNILLIPASALGRLPRLMSLQIDFNRIAALSGDIVGSVAEKAEQLSLARNVIREIPDGTFRRCKRLRKLDLGGNLLSGTPSAAMFTGTEETLIELLLPYNRLTGFSDQITFTVLQKLDLSNNRLTGLSSNTFGRMPELFFLNLSSNARLGNSLAADVLGSRPRQLEILDLSRTGLKNLPVQLLSFTPNLKELYLSGNALSELNERSFVDMRNLSVVDLSNNRLASIKAHAFVNVMSIRRLLLNNNKIMSYGGEIFNTGTGLEELDLSSNRLAYMSQTSFRIHPRLKYLNLAENRLNYFPAAELITGLQYLEYLNLAGNKLINIEELDFSRMPHLRELSFAGNILETIGDLAFHNSSQLQTLDFSSNKLSRINERSLEGLIRLRMLKLNNNKLSELPDTLFDRSRIQSLDSIDLSNNEFGTTGAPLRALRRQHFAITHINLSNNKLTSVPADDTVLVNVESLDLSHNPLSEEAVNAVLGEPKTVRVLNLASTGLKHVGRLETPFLKHLNLSNNNITDVSSSAFERTSLLESLDISNNSLRNVGVIKPPPALCNLYFSNNPIERISAGDLKTFNSLLELHLSHLPLCTRLEKDAFIPLRRLKILELYGYPRLGYLDVKGLLKHLPTVEQLNIEYMDPVFGGGGESITSELHPVRLRELGVHGARVNAVAPGALSSLRAPNFLARFSDTSLTTLPPTLFFPVPRSTEITLDVTGSKLNTVSTQLLAAIDDRRGRLTVLGLETIPLLCDCTARSLKQYLLNTQSNNGITFGLRCANPERLSGVLLMDASDDQLTCGSQTPRPVRRTSTSQTTKKITTPVTSVSEPDIIWSVEPRPPARSRGAQTGPQPSTTPSNDDTLIIGIVGGVVSFIAILIIGICIVRLKSSNNQSHRHGPAIIGGPPSICACSSVKGQPVYAYPGAHLATLTRGPPPSPQIYQQPYFVPYPPSVMAVQDDKMSHR